MATLPQLLEEDIRVLSAALEALVSQSEATSALVLDKGGFLIDQAGDCSMFDATTLGALAAGIFAATQGIASLVNEANFSSVYQQGESHSLLVNDIDEHCLLVVIFGAQVSVGAVKYYATSAIAQVAHQMEAARHRSPEEGIDLSILNLADSADLFGRKSADDAPASPAITNLPAPSHAAPSQPAHGHAPAHAAQPAPSHPGGTEHLGLGHLFARKAAATQAPESHEPVDSDPTVKLQKIKKLLASGLITQDDFEFKKRKILEDL
jgi:predicted regulator of Ras-like GTPase activity (Roadblock/LC7/MglB family)